jgi:hypothetical protein
MLQIAGFPPLPSPPPPTFVMPEFDLRALHLLFRNYFYFIHLFIYFLVGENFELKALGW